MIIVKTKSELKAMKNAGRIAANALQVGGQAVRPGVTTQEINDKIHRYILSEGATPSFLGYGGFPASACVSVNEVVIHGIPDNRVVHEGDIVSIDVGAYFEGFHGDNAATFACGNISAEAQSLMDVTKECLYRGIAAAVVGNRIGDISSAVQQHADAFGYGIVRDFVGHGVGSDMHEDPQVPNYGPAGRGPRLIEGMTIAIEPMINLGTANVRILDDEWTVITTDNKWSAHFEHTIAITADGPEILTMPSGEHNA